MVKSLLLGFLATLSSPGRFCGFCPLDDRATGWQKPGTPAPFLNSLFNETQAQ
jgi:hypothetical protein